MVSAAARKLEDLPERPPTPPRESHNELRRSFPGRIFSKIIGSHTPNNSPPSAATTTAEKVQKRVEWSELTDYQESPKTPVYDDPAVREALRSLPPSGNQKPSKSILKPYNGATLDRQTGTDKHTPPHHYRNFATMLESTVQALAGTDRTSRVDAYGNLSTVLRVSDNISDSASLKDKMGLLTQFIQRDMVAKDDTPMTIRALTLLASFLHNPSTVEWMGVDFRNFVIDFAIGAFEDPGISKGVKKHMMFIVANQNFSSKTMTTERVARLVKSLHQIENHVKGRSIVIARMDVYRKLLKQSKNAMAANPAWLQDMLADILSSLEIQGPAIAFGLEAALHMGTDKQTSRAFMEFFSSNYEGGCYGDWFGDRLTSMVRNQTLSASVPQIWSVVILFMRSKQQQVEQWRFLGHWLRILQVCFNSSDHNTKVQANIAWNRFVFVVRLDEKTPLNVIKMLAQPLSAQLERKRGHSSKLTKEARQVTISSVCNLLYYAMRPSATSGQLDLYWNEYVILLIGKLLSPKVQEDVSTAKEVEAYACAILSAFFDTSGSSNPKLWNINRANEPNALCPEDLPPLDPKWIRKHVCRTLELLEPLMERCFWDFGSDASPICIMWQRFTSCIAAAGAKEIKVSDETMECVARIFTLLYRIWEKGPHNLIVPKTGESHKFLAAFKGILATTISNLGTLPFTEKLLSLNQQQTFAVVATPSQRPSRPIGDARVPFHHLLLLIAHPPDDVKCEEMYFETVEATLKPFFNDRHSLWSRIEFTKDLSVLLEMSGVPLRAATVIWQVVAGLTVVAIHQKELNNINVSGSGSGSGSHEQPPGAGFRNIFRVLDCGIVLSPSVPLQGWKDLFEAVSELITIEAGDSGRVMSIIEPLARTLKTSILRADGKSGVAYCSMLLGSAAFPRERQSYDAAQRRLWGATSAGSKSSFFDPYSHLYATLNLCLEKSYKDLKDEPGAIEDLFAKTINFVQRSPSSNILNVLINTQAGLALWFSDSDNKLGRPKIRVLAKYVAKLWADLSTVIAQMEIGTSLLRTLEVLICSGLESRHKVIVTTAVTTWNTTFGKQAKLEYPERVKDSLLKLRSIADLELPSLSASLLFEGDSSAPLFLDSQDDSIFFQPEDEAKTSANREQTSSTSYSPLPRTRLRSSPRVSDGPASSASRKRQLDEVTSTGRRKIAKREVTPKFRHDDSQIQFAAIVSSPLADTVVDSQILTDRQREVKERQRKEAVMFPDIRSSPRRTRAASKLAITSTPGIEEALTNPELSTPILLPLPKGIYDNFITSSPTPRRENINLQIESDAIDPPSSPPERASGRLFGGVETKISQEDSDYADHDMLDLPSSPLQEYVSEDSTALPSAQVVSGNCYDISGETTTSVNMSSFSDTHNIGRPSTPVGSQKTTSEAQSSRAANEIFKDALSSPVIFTPSENEKTVDVFVDATSSPRRAEVVQSSKRRVLRSSSRSTVEQSHATPPPRTRSSSLSIMDEESLLRLVGEFDEQPELILKDNNLSPQSPRDRRSISPEDGGRPEIMATEATSVIISSDGEPDFATESDTSNGAKVIQENKTVVKPNTGDRLQLEAAIMKPISAFARLLGRKQVPSGIPETPRNEPLGGKSKVDILAEVSRITDGSEGSPAVNSKRIRSSARRQVTTTPNDEKEREIGNGEYLEEVPCSQEAEKPQTVPPAKSLEVKSSPKAPKRGRPKKTTVTLSRQPSHLSAMQTDGVDDEEAVRASSVDLDGSLQDADDTASQIMAQLGDSQQEAMGLIQSSTDITSMAMKDNLEMSVEVASKFILDEGTSQEVEQRVGIGLEHGDGQTTALVTSPVVKVTPVAGPTESLAGPAAVSTVMSQFESFLGTLRGTALTRPDAEKMLKDMVWELEGEIRAAEKRGRNI